MVSPVGKGDVMHGHDVGLAALFDVAVGGTCWLFFRNQINKRRSVEFLRRNFL